MELELNKMNAFVQITKKLFWLFLAKRLIIYCNNHLLTQ